MFSLWFQEEVRAEAEAAVKEALEEAECEQREVTPLLRVRVAGLSSALEGDNQGAGPVCEAILSIWRPSEDQVRMHPPREDIAPE